MNCMLLKYPRLLLLVLTFVIAYALFAGRSFTPLRMLLLNSGYVGVFIAGMLYSYGFTAAPATAALLIMAGGQNMVAAGMLGGLGSLFTDIIIFKFIRRSFQGEIDKLSMERPIRKIKAALPPLARKYILPVVAAIVIASPLPDEMGVSMMAMSKTVGTKAFYLASFALNTAGIFVILWLGNMV